MCYYKKTIAYLVLHCSALVATGIGLLEKQLCLELLWYLMLSLAGV